MTEELLDDGSPHGGTGRMSAGDCPRRCGRWRWCRWAAVPAAHGQPYCYEWDDLLAQQAQGELERTQALQNRIRLLPSSREVQRMEVAICWPAEYLAPLVHLLRAVNAVALAHSLDRDAGWIAAKRGGYADTWRERHDHGCEIIARGLRSCRVPVF